MSRGRAAVLLGAFGVGLGLSLANAGERVVLDLGVVRLYRVPLPWVLWFGVLLGMVLMVAIQWAQDAELRRWLEEHGLTGPSDPDCAPRNRPSAPADPLDGPPR
jgi:hypothetical protein